MAETDDPLAEDVPCMRCDYNLRTRRPSEICPECAHSVQASIRYHADRSSIIPFPMLTTTAFSLIALAFAVRPAPLLVPFAYPTIWYSLVSAMFAMLFTGLFASGGVMLLFSLRKSAITNPDRQSRARAAMLGYVVLSLLSTGFAVFRLTHYPGSYRFSPVRWSPDLLLIGANVAMLGIYIGCISYLPRLARRIQSPFLSGLGILLFSALSLWQLALLVWNFYSWYALLMGEMPLRIRLVSTTLSYGNLALCMAVAVYMIAFARAVRLFARKNPVDRLQKNSENHAVIPNDISSTASPSTGV